MLMLQTFLLSNTWPKLRFPRSLFLQPSIQSYGERKILEHICSGQKWGTLPTHDWKIQLWWEASALCASGETIFCLKYATSQEHVSCDYKSPVQSLHQCPTSRTTPTQCWPQFVPPFPKVWAQTFQKLFNYFLDSHSWMFLLKLSHLRAKRQKGFHQRGSGTEWKEFPQGYPRTFGKAGLTTRPGCPMDGEMHLQMEIGNQAAMDHPQRGSRSEI